MFVLAGTIGMRDWDSVVRNFRRSGDSATFSVMVAAVALVTSAHTAAMPFLPEFAARSSELGPGGHVRHVAALTAAFPAAALITAPIWGWASDRAGSRLLLVASVAFFGLAALLFGHGGIRGLYFSRFSLGVSSASIITIAFAVTAAGAGGCVTRARRFAWLTASMFFGDLVGPMLGESSRFLGASSPLTIIAALILPLLIAVGTVPLPNPPAKEIVPAKAAGPTRSKGFASLFVVAIVGGGGLATLHVLLLLSEQPGGLTRQAVSLTLSGCGVGMLAAQLSYSRGRRLAQHARGIIRPTLLVFVGSIVAAAYLDNTLLLSGAVFVAGWTAATLRLVTSYLVSRIDRHRMGFWLGLNQSATSLGQTAAPLVIAGVGVAGREVMLVILAAATLLLVLFGGRLTPAFKAPAANVAATPRGDAPRR